MKFRMLQVIASPSSVCASARTGTRVSKAEEFLPLLAFAFAGLISVFATPVHAQTSQFLFDANGNLGIQLADAAFPPRIIGQPQNQVVGTNESAAFSVIVADARSMTFQWRFNGSAINGETAISLSLGNVTPSQEGTYQVVLTNPSGSVTSAPALLWIDNDSDGLGDSWELTHFGNLTRNATSDTDGDGVTNQREFLDGSDPTDPNSARYRLFVVREGGAVIRNPDQTTYNKGQSVALTATAGPNKLFHAWLGDAVTRDNPITLVMTNDKTVYARFTPINFLWTNGTSGNWEIATNWSPNLVPGLDDSVQITNGVTVTLNTNADCADVTLGGTIFSAVTGSGTLKIRRDLIWTAGSMSGTGRTILESNALLTLRGGVTLNGRTLENRGTIVWSRGQIVGVIGGAVIANHPGALFRVENQDASSLGGGIAAGRFDNSGTFRKVSGSGVLNFSSGLNFNNTGTVEIEANLLNCGGGFTNHGAVILSPGTTNVLAAGGSGSGAFFAPATAFVEWTAGTFTLNSGGQLNGAGLYRIRSPATVVANATFAVSNLELNNGTLDGTGTVTVSGAMNWLGGTMSGSGRTIIPPGVTLNVSTVSSLGLNARTLENQGTVLWTGVGNLAINFGGVFTNRADALFHIQNDATVVVAAGSGRLDNAGIIRKSGSVGTTTIGSSFNNSGSVEIQSGTVVSAGSFNQTGAVNLSPGTTLRMTGGGTAAGAFSAPPTALVEWTAGSFTLNAGAQLNGAGLYVIKGGTLTCNADCAVDNLDLVAGTLNGASNVTINSVMNWIAGTMAASGRTIVPFGAALNIANPNFLGLQRTLENGGTVRWTGPGIIGLLNGVITNRPGGLFQTLNTARVAFSGGVARIDNAGTFQRSGNSGTNTFDAGVTFNNAGALDIRSGTLACGGPYLSTSNSLLRCGIGGLLPGTEYGRLAVSGAATLDGALGVDFTNGFLPSTNDAFGVLTFGSRVGIFREFFYPSNEVTMVLSNSPSSAIARVIGVLPPSEAPRLLTPERQGPDFKLIWLAISNRTYRVEFNGDLNLTNWLSLPGDVTASSNTASKLDPFTLTNRFYRVRLLP